MKPYYEDDAVSIYHADCRDLLPIAAGLVFADPPYGVRLDYGNDADDTGSSLLGLIAEVHPLLLASAPVVLVTPGIRNIWSWPSATWVVGWHKPGSTRRSDLGGFNTWEPVLVYGKRRVWQDSVTLPACVAHRGSRNNVESGATGDHPAPKPLRLMTWILEQFSKPEELILDPFMGSGTTLRAAKDLGRRGIGIEINEAYCEIAARRMGQEVLAL